MDKNNIAVYLIKQIKYFNNPFALDDMKSDVNKVRKGSLTVKLANWCDFWGLTYSEEQITMIADYINGKRFFSLTYTQFLKKLALNA